MAAYVVKVFLKGGTFRIAEVQADSRMGAIQKAEEAVIADLEAGGQKAPQAFAFNIISEDGRSPDD